MKNKFYIMTALVISLTGCSNIEDGTQPTGNFPEDHIIRIVTEVNAPVSRARSRTVFRTIQRDVQITSRSIGRQLITAFRF